MVLRELISFYLPFDSSEMIDLFTGVDFTLFSESELFISTLLFNVLFIVFIFLMIYVFLKILYKVSSWLF